MLDYKTLYNSDPFELEIKKKDPWYLANQKKLCLYHYKNSNNYKLILDNIFKSISKVKRISNLPFIHASLFKNFNLISINDNQKISTFSSSGTTDSKQSKINLDPKTSLLQTKALSKIFSKIINKDKDIFFIENKNFLNSRESMSAKGAAIKGFGQLCNKKYFILDGNNKINFTILKNYLKKNKNKEFIIFGFTSSVWFNLLKEAKRQKIKLKKNQGILIHGGGWKKMYNLKVDNNKFKKEIKSVFGLKQVYNYYGMIEQTGSVFLECEKGYFHCSTFSDIFIRNSKLELSKIKEVGLIQTLSLLPLSYPGHNILTEDLGIIHGVDDCSCGKKGKYFTVLGRVPNAELRGCSDVA
jgi:phenylacetate-coenzyme A ligase PaaK-like adenylate-forming protein